MSTRSVQVEEVVRRFPDVLVPVLVYAAGGAAASDFLRTVAFRLLSDALQRCASGGGFTEKCVFFQRWKVVNCSGLLINQLSLRGARRMEFLLTANTSFSGGFGTCSL